MANRLDVVAIRANDEGRVHTEPKFWFAALTHAGPVVYGAFLDGRLTSQQCLVRCCCARQFRGSRIRDSSRPRASDPAKGS